MSTIVLTSNKPEDIRLLAALAEFRANPDDYVTLEEFTDTQARSAELRESRI